MDDKTLFDDAKARLWDCKRGIIARLARLRLTLHEGSAQVAPVASGIPWLGFLVYPTHRRVKARKVVQGTRRPSTRFDAWRSRHVSFAEFDASVNGWINHLRYADAWGLREHVLRRFVWGPEANGIPLGQTGSG